MTVKRPIYVFYLHRKITALLNLINYRYDTTK